MHNNSNILTPWHRSTSSSIESSFKNICSIENVEQNETKVITIRSALNPCQWSIAKLTNNDFHAKLINFNRESVYTKIVLRISWKWFKESNGLTLKELNKFKCCRGWNRFLKDAGNLWNPRMPALCALNCLYTYTHTKKCIDYVAFSRLLLCSTCSYIYTNKNTHTYIEKYLTMK